MSFPRHLPALLLLLCAQATAWSLGSRASPQRACLSCRRGLREPVGEGGTSLLALGEPCGVYTLSCAKGLRCLPPLREPSPLQALIQGRGVCARQSRGEVTDRPDLTVPPPRNTGDLEKAPCRKLLNSVLRGLELTIIQSNRDIYIPNCDTKGFYRKKQCRSSKGMQRGHCWCVDEHGTPLQSRAAADGTLPCDGD